MVVERKASPHAPSEGAVTAGAASGIAQQGQPEGGDGDLYAEEQRFWRERCPYRAETTTADRRENETNAVAVQRKTPPASSRSPPGTQPAVGRAANYDYFSAEAAYRSSPRNQATADPYPDSDEDGYVGGGRGSSTPSRHRRTNFDREVGDGLNDTDNTPPKLLQPPQTAWRQVARDRRGGHAVESGRKRNVERRRSCSRSRSLRDAEAVLNGALESVQGGLTTVEVISATSVVQCYLCWGFV